MNAYITVLVWHKWRWFVVSNKSKKKQNRVYKPPADAKVVNFSPAQLAQLSAMMQVNMQPGNEQATAFPPGSPILPTPGVTLKDGPRQWQYPVGYNIGQYPRSTELNTFDTLRNLSALYDGIQLCEQAWFDLCSKLELDIKPTPEALKAAGGDETAFEDDIARYKEFFSMPDKDNDLDLKSWVRMALRDQLELDAVAVYVRPNRGGGVYSLELVDSATIKPLITASGRKPLPPYPSYQQFWQGLPLDWYTSDQMLYQRETTRSDSVYGTSRVERIIMRVNQALRKQNKDMNRFTDGNLPAGILEMPANENQEWTPDQVILYQQLWDGLLAGNDTSRSRLKVVEPGAKFTKLDEDDIMTPFDTFVLNVTVACFGLTMAELGFTENVNKSSGDSQENVTYRRAMRPLMNRFAELFTLILKKYFNEKRFIVGWSGYEEAEDIVQQSTAYSGLVRLGVISPTMAAKLMKIPSEEGEQPIPRYYAAAAGPIFFDDLLDPEIRKAQKAATMNGFTLANQQTTPGQPGGGNDATKGGTDGGGGDGSEMDGGNVPGTGGTTGGGDEAARAISSDLRRWRDVAIKDVQRGKPVRAFTSDVIPEGLHRQIGHMLALCESVNGVKFVFDTLKGDVLVEVAA